jgi:RNA polymerase sigma-70 factor (sigma-E family)
MRGAIAMKDTPRSVAEIYAVFAPPAARLAYLLTGDKHLAEDLVQEAFLKMLGRFGHLRGPDSFQAYLNQIVVNLARKHWRRRDLERRYEKQAKALSPSDVIGIPDVETSDELWTALLRLPYRQRAAIVLRFYEDLSEQKTAELLNCSPKAVRSLVGRAKESLRAEAEQGALG